MHSDTEFILCRMERGGIVEKKDVKILVVDDQAADMVAKLLQKWGYAAYPVESGMEALAILELDDSFTVIFLDYEMPGMNGVELAQALRTRNARQKLVLISSYPLDQIQGANEIKFDAVIRKPFNGEELSNAIQRLTEA